MSEFELLVRSEFGRARGSAVVVDHVLPVLGGRTPARAIADGFDPRVVWAALCEDFDVPPERRLGPDL